MNISQASIDELVDLLKVYNEAYRQGAPMVGDDEYDALVEQLRDMAPEHAFLQSVEPEQFSGRQEVRHPVPMLSIEKAYTRDQLARFVARVQKEAPPWALFSARSCPPCFSTICSQIDSPKPIPLPVLVVKNGSKMSGITVGWMPGPLSMTRI